MHFYKDTANKIHGLESTDFERLLPSGSIKITEEEAAILQSPSPLVPQSVGALQGLLAIDQAGLSSAYEAWANDPARTFAERAFINKAQNWRRDDATLIAAATALGLTSEQVDNMFMLADE